MCAGIARALGESPEYVMRLAGLLPPPADDATIAEITALLKTLSPDTRQQVLDYVRFLSQQHKDP